jgi:ATP/maltotriose-dependent transcriptional regulator MalT
VTLISAPAGFGKTTLVSEWVAGCERPAAWLSLDEGDNDPTRFLACLVAALQTIVPTIGAGVLGVLQSPQRYRQRPAEVRVERALHLHVNRDEAAIQQVIAQLVCLESCCYDSTQRNIQ